MTATKMAMKPPTMVAHMRPKPVKKMERRLSKLRSKVVHSGLKAFETGTASCSNPPWRRARRSLSMGDAWVVMRPVVADGMGSGLRRNDGGG